jgi:2-succinyl-5-enolpyruvyl-6-hydroxy-3-cyclohexene-1-carboxylate synthase
MFVTTISVGVVYELKMQAYKIADAWTTLLAWPASEEKIAELVAHADSIQEHEEITHYVLCVHSPDQTMKLTAVHVISFGSSVCVESILSYSLIGRS